MKITELIKSLQDQLLKYGDINVKVNPDDGSALSDPDELIYRKASKSLDGIEKPPYIYIE